MIKAMFKTISKMKRCIRTSYGDSDTFYSEDGITRFHGILQGNGAGPAIWVMISTPMLDRLRAEGFGIKIELEDGSSLIIPAFAFVDDVDLIQELDNLDNTMPQKIVNCWENSLTSTGGALVPEKCRYTVVKYKWEHNEWTIIPIKDPNTNITIKGDTGIQQEIEQITNQSGEMALGIKFSPIHSNHDEVIHLEEKGKQWAEYVRTGHLRRNEAWVCLETTIMNTINYLIETANR
jgi:hypothetical protein